MNPVLHRKPLSRLNCALRTAICNRFAFSILFFAISFQISAQSKLAFEQYNYIRQKDAAVFVPMAHFETNNNWYAELRYNYEDAQTLSVFGGKTINGGRAFSYSFTPMAGFSGGRFTGVTAALNNEAEWKDFYFCAQSQYSIATKKDITDFFFNWSELGYSISDRFFSGLAMQYTLQEGNSCVEPGIVAGVTFNRFSLPIYVFNPLRSDCYFVVGLNYEYNFKKKNK